jgi:hypothetical protein
VVGRAGGEVQHPVQEQPHSGEQLELGNELDSPGSSHPMRIVAA